MINLFLKKWHKQFENVKSIVSYINDSDFFYIITLELISALNDFDDGQNYDELNEELGKHMYFSLFGDSITLEKLKVLVHPNIENGDKYGEGDIYWLTVKSLEELFKEHHSEILIDISTRIESNELDDVAIYTVLKILDRLEG